MVMGCSQSYSMFGFKEWEERKGERNEGKRRNFMFNQIIKMRLILFFIQFFFLIFLCFHSSHLPLFFQLNVDYKLAAFFFFFHSSPLLLFFPTKYELKVSRLGSWPFFALIFSSFLYFLSLSSPTIFSNQTWAKS